MKNLAFILCALCVLGVSSSCAFIEGVRQSDNGTRARLVLPVRLPASELQLRFPVPRTSYNPATDHGSAQ
jgi:hypothetical protein